MRLSARLVGGEAMMGRVDGDHSWAAIAPVDAFYSRLDEHMAFAELLRGGLPTAADASGAKPLAMTWGLPIPTTSRIFCVGLNYREHVAETGNPLPDQPTIFARFRTSMTVHGAVVDVPVTEDGLDYEAELAAVIQCDSRGARPFAYTCFNDVTARGHQHDTSQWTLGKNLDGSGALGPDLVTDDELGDDLAGLAIRARLNGTVVQESTLGDMIFSLDEVVARIAEMTLLRTGDVIALGTPSGVGHARDPVLLGHAGDVFEVEIDRLGTLRTFVGPVPRPT